jgi:hypothetical protein
MAKNIVIKHLKGDIKTFKKEAAEDRELIKKLHHSKKSQPKAGSSKVHKVMEEFEHKTLHSGSKKGPVVRNKKQAVAIALSESRKAGAKIPRKKR